jgi:hypothetical protein
MNYLYKDLSTRDAGDRIRFTISGNAANVRLLTASNFAAYKAGRRFESYGGHATQSPVVLAIPSAGHWYGVVDFGVNPGSSRVAIEVLGLAA